jgi:hypothetical protein
MEKEKREAEAASLFSHKERSSFLGRTNGIVASMGLPGTNYLLAT